MKGRLRERLKETGRKSKWWKRGSQVGWTVGRMGAGEIISDFMCWNSHSCHKLLNFFLMKTFLRWQMNIFLNFFSWNITLQQDALEKCQEKKTEGGKVLGWEEDKMIYVWTYGGRSLTSSSSLPDLLGGTISSWTPTRLAHFLLGLVQ